ncbi:Inositol 2-dehydrogenase/D-chiro-inositol 3-dehydrogenase [bacterium YEK0313]|nr:Inositol 2-dehydrogenase/D-chiro-inositol 3-dehydrogenase [bacterium YEK0313]
MTTIGLVGYGRWGKLIFRDLRALGVDVHVAVPSEACRAAAAAAGAVGTCAAAEGLPPCEGYVVATPTVLHAGTVACLLPRGRPIFVEKPLTNDVVAARRLVAEGRDLIFVMDKWRYHPGIVELGRLVRSGALGEIVSLRSFRLGWGNPHRDVDAIWILLPHDLSIALEVLGHLPAASFAMAGPPSRANSEFLAVLRDGEAGPRVTLEISERHPATRRAVTVAGSLGVAQLADSYDDRVLLMTADDAPGAKPREIPVGTDMPLFLELQAFVCHLAGGPAPKSSASDALMIVERIDALRRLAGLA